MSRASVRPVDKSAGLILGSVVITLTSNVIMNLFLQHWLAITAPTELLSHPYY